MNKAVLPAGQAIHEQLAQLGYKPSDIDYILMSHMHCDHADGLRLVKHAKRIMLVNLNMMRFKRIKCIIYNMNG